MRQLRWTLRTIAFRCAFNGYFLINRFDYIMMPKSNCKISWLSLQSISMFVSKCGIVGNWILFAQFDDRSKGSAVVCKQKHGEECF